MHQTIIKKIKELRISKNLNHIDMAEMLHINKTAYYRLESGHTITWAKYLKDILKIFEISELDFLNEIINELKEKINDKSRCKFGEQIKNLEIIILEKENIIKDLKYLLEQHKSQNRK